MEGLRPAGIGSGSVLRDIWPNPLYINPATPGPLSPGLDSPQGINTPYELRTAIFPKN